MSILDNSNLGPNGEELVVMRRSDLMEAIDTAIEKALTRSGYKIVPIPKRCESKSLLGVQCGLPEGHHGNHANGTLGVWK